MARISRTGSVIRVLALLFLLPVPVFGQKVIPAGYDLWVTVGDGSTVVDFGKDPIPPGVFSEDSEAFTGLVRLRGEPLLTDPPGLLHDTDTIVERPRDAVPDGRPIAVRMLALSLKSIEPLEIRDSRGTSRWDMWVSLAAEQPESEMRIYAESESGGRYDADIRIEFKATFVNSKTGESLTAHRGLTLRTTGVRWLYYPGELLAKKVDLDSLAPCSVAVDQDRDAIQDASLRGWCGPELFLPVSAGASRPQVASAGTLRQNRRGYALASALGPAPATTALVDDTFTPGSYFVAIEVALHAVVEEIEGELEVVSAGGATHVVRMWVYLGCGPDGWSCDDGDPCTINNRCRFRLHRPGVTDPDELNYCDPGQPLCPDTECLVDRCVDGQCTGGTQVPCPSSECIGRECQIVECVDDFWRIDECMIGTCSAGEKYGKCVGAECREPGCQIMECAGGSWGDGECAFGTCGESDKFGFCVGPPKWMDIDDDSELECVQNLECCPDLECWVDRKCQIDFCPRSGSVVVVGGRCVGGTFLDPGLCQKCNLGTVVADDTEDPGSCERCEDGTVVVDDGEDPGLCERCEDGAVAVDDTEDPGLCERCEDGVAVADDTEDPGVCEKCEGGAAVADDTEDPGMCEKCESGAAVADDTEDPGECEKCQDGAAAADDAEPCDDGDPCTKNDRCLGRRCIGDPVTSAEDPDCG